MIVARGWSAELLLTDGRAVKPAGAILQDETGTELPRDVCIIMPIKKTGRPLASPPPEAKRQLRGTAPLEGRVKLPALSKGWREVGQVQEAWYCRREEPDTTRHHRFGARGLFRRGAALPVLYKRDGAYKLVLAPSSVWDWRGVSG